MILKARPANGSSSERWRITGSSLSILRPLIGGDVGRRRQVVDHGVEQRLHALVLEGRAAEHGHEGIGDRALADAAPQRLGDRAPRRSR